MAKKLGKRWRLESTNPDQALWGLEDGDPRTAWQRLWEFNDDNYANYEGLVAELNQINAPVVLRIVRSGD